MNDIVQRQPAGGILSTASDTAAVKSRMRAIGDIMKSIMIEGVHYGRIPGTQQPSLYKPGSEALLAAFQIAVQPQAAESRDADGHITYRVSVTGVHQPSGTVIGVGIGEASTAEEKYAWRAAVCDQEFEDTPATHRRVKWNKGKWDAEKKVHGEPWSVKQVRTNPADLANTVLKMAKKRGQIDLCLTALGASDVFTQDLEDLPPEYFGEDGAPAAGERRKKQDRYSQPRERGQGGGGQGGGGGGNKPASANQVGLIRNRIQRSNGKVTEDQVKEKFAVAKIEDLRMSQVDEVLAFIDAKPAAAPAAEGATSNA